MAAQVEIEDQSSVTELDNGEIFDPPLSDDADSSSSTGSSSTILLRQGNQEHDVIRACFLSGLGSPAIAGDTTVVSVRKSSTEGIATRAKHVSFRIFTEAVARKNGGDPNVKYGWYAAGGGSREEIERIVSYGFSSREIDGDSGGVGVHLVPSKYSLLAAEGAEPDNEGLRHLLLCRVLLGKSEQIVSGSKQSHPSSSEFDSGVDDLQNPRKYVVWSSNMNSHVLPGYIVSFKSPRLRVIGRGGGGAPARPGSPWVSFAALMSMLAKSVDASRMNLIMRTYDDFMKRKIQRDQLVRKMRQVAGDNLLAQIIKNHRDKYKNRV